MSRPTAPLAGTTRNRRSPAGSAHERAGRALSVALPALLAIPACGGPDASAPTLPRFAAVADPATYVVRYRQEIRWGPVDVARDYAARYTISFPAGTMAPGAIGTAAHGDGDWGVDEATPPEITASAALDSFAVVVTTPHGRQAFDTRHLVGETFVLRIAPRGGEPAYPDGVPRLDMGATLEGEVSLDRLLVYGFPRLPDTPVRPCDVWADTATARRVEAQVTVAGPLVTEYRLAGRETADGVELLRIEGHAAGRLAGETEPGGGRPAVAYEGVLEGRITWLFDPRSGTVAGVTGEEISEGVLRTPASETPLRQVTTIEIGRAGAGR